MEQARALAHLIDEATRSMTALQAEMEAKAALAAELSADAERARRIAKTSREDAALAAEFARLLRAESWSSFWLGPW